MLKYKSPARRVRAGMGVDVGVAVGAGVMTGLPVAVAVAVADGVAIDVADALPDGVTDGAAVGEAVRVADAFEAGAQPDSTRQIPITKAVNLPHAFRLLLTEPSWRLGPLAGHRPEVRAESCALESTTTTEGQATHIPSPDLNRRPILDNDPEARSGTLPPGPLSTCRSHPCQGQATGWRDELV
jgi:hypothetical protein